MKKIIAIVAGEPNSISSEIIFKIWKLKNLYLHKPFFVIGSFNLLNMQKRFLKYKFKIKKINNNFKLNELQGTQLPVYDVDYIQKKPFEKLSLKSNRYIFKCFDAALNFSKKKKIMGFINCPVSKEHLFKNEYQGVTEFLAKKAGIKGSSVMLIFNKKLAVSPITTHISLNQVSKQLNADKIVEKVIVINNFYKKFLKKKVKFGILGLNPHNYSTGKLSEEKTIISKAIKRLKNLKIKVVGPISADSSFMISNKYNFDVIIGMYHDQVLTPFKALYQFDAINITLGLPYIRISPDHGVANNLVGKKEASHLSLIESIKFFNLIK
jgi:4-hydroxythreonine-4-phosphate dehydrogenase